MKKESVQILGCKMGKVITVDYFNLEDQLNYTVQDNQVPHPDLKETLLDFRDDLAGAFSVLGEAKYNFIPNGFKVTESEGEFFITISGKFTTRHDDTINVSSGKIMLGTVKTDIHNKLNHAREELFQYIWVGKSSEQELPFEEKDQDDPENES